MNPDYIYVTNTKRNGTHDNDRMEYTNPPKLNLSKTCLHNIVIILNIIVLQVYLKKKSLMLENNTKTGCMVIQEWCNDLSKTICYQQ